LYVPIRNGDKRLTFQTNNPGEGNGHPQDRRFHGSQMVITPFEPENVWKKAFLEN
jgi:hypothetical protein